MWNYHVNTIWIQRELWVGELLSSTNLKEGHLTGWHDSQNIALRVIPHHAPSKKSLRWPVHEASRSHFFWGAKTKSDTKFHPWQLTHDLHVAWKWPLENEIPFRCHHFSVPCVFNVKQRSKHRKHSKPSAAKKPSHTYNCEDNNCHVPWLHGSLSFSAQWRLDQHGNKQIRSNNYTSTRQHEEDHETLTHFFQDRPSLESRDNTHAIGISANKKPCVAQIQNKSDRTTPTSPFTSQLAFENIR